MPKNILQARQSPGSNATIVGDFQLPTLPARDALNWHSTRLREAAELAKGDE